MKFLSLQLLAIVATFHLVSSADDLCFPELCTKLPPAGCGATVNKSNTCADNFFLYTMTDAKIDFILNQHNNKRNKYAGGDGVGAKQLLPASRMSTMQWNKDLEILAGYTVQQCALKHTCVSTPNMPNAGQNLGMQGFRDLDELKMFEDTINGWEEERPYVTMANIKTYPGGEQPYGHFTALVNEKSNLIGCKAASYDANMPDYPGMKWYFIVCNYAYNNMKGEPIYVATTNGAKPASGCKTGVNPKYPNLCSINEKY